MFGADFQSVERAKHPVGVLAEQAGEQVAIRSRVRASSWPNIP